MKYPNSIDAVYLVFGEYLKKLYISSVNDMVDVHKIISFPEKIFVSVWIYWCSSTRSHLQLCPQFQIKKYRVDFYIPSMNTVVEIDSIAFHERTTKQLEYERKRHREIEELGYKIVRYAATEIMNDPNLIYDLMTRDTEWVKSWKELL